MRKDLFLECLVGPWATKGDDVQYKIDLDKRHATVYFQFTESVKDWLDNFDAKIVPYRGANWKAHKGFIRKYKSIADELMATLSQYESVTFVGYSQGAALAILAHEDYFYRFGKYPVTYAFACPRVVSWQSGNIWSRWAFCNIINHRRDLVGHVPLVIMGYRHPVKVSYFGNAGIPSHKFHFPQVYEAGL